MKKLLQAISGKLSELNELRQRKKAPKEKQTSQRSAPIHEKTSKVELEIPSRTVVKVLLILLLFLIGAQIFVQLKSVVIITVICLFLSMGLSPIVDAIEQRSVPRPLAILILYALFLGVLGILFVAIIPILSEQLFAIAREVTEFFSGDGIPIIHGLFAKFQFDSTEVQKFITENLTAISQNLKGVAGSTFWILSGIFQGVFNFIFALVLLFFILMEREAIGNFFLSLVPMRDQEYLIKKSKRVQSKLSDWFRGQVILMISMGLFMYAGMKVFEFIFGMQYAATIGLLAAFMELFPYIGVLITGILAGLIAVNISWILLLFVIGWIALAQFLEGNFLVPIVMEKATGLSSVVVILALASGGLLGNAIGGVPLAILGMILAIPIAASIAIFVEEVSKKKY